MESEVLKYSVQLNEDIELKTIAEMGSVNREVSFSLKRVMAYFLLGWSLTAFVCLIIGSFICQ